MQKSDVQITINSGLLEDLLFRSRELLAALFDIGAIEKTLDGVFTNDKNQSAEANAYEWVSVYYEQVTAAVYTANTLLNILTDAIANMEVEFAPYKRDAAKGEG
jgi:hypothetical protein